MSLIITKCKCSVELKDEGVLKSALKELGQIVRNVTVAGNYKADIALKGRSYGFQWDAEQKQYMFVGNRTAAGRELRDIEKRYVNKALNKAMRKSGMNIKKQKEYATVGVSL